MTASAQAAEHARSMTQMTQMLECQTSATFAYDVQYDERIAAYGIAGLLVEGFMPECEGRDVVVAVLGPAGETIATSRIQLADGATATFAEDAPVDARDVTALQVLPG